jgi:hypothetical protein
LKFHLLHYLSCPLLWNCSVLEETCYLVFSYYSCISTLGFTHVRTSFWLAVLISWVLSIGIFTTQARLSSVWVVIYFLITKLGLFDSLVKHSTTVLKTLIQSHYSTQRQDAEPRKQSNLIVTQNENTAIPIKNNH